MLCFFHVVHVVLIHRTVPVLVFFVQGIKDIGGSSAGSWSGAESIVCYNDPQTLSRFFFSECLVLFSRIRAYVLHLWTLPFTQLRV